LSVVNQSAEDDMSASPAEDYLDKSQEILDTVRRQLPAIRAVADVFAASILADRVVHLFGAGHSRMMVEEMWPRYGSFPGFHPIVELSMTFHNQVVGANGQRQAMFLENTSGLASRILRNFSLSPLDSALVVSSSGCNVVPIEMAEGFKAAGMKVVGLVSLEHARGSETRHAKGTKLMDVCDLVLDTGAPLGDAMVHVDGLATPVGPGSTLGGVLVVNAIKVEVAARLTAAGHAPKVLTASAIVGQAEAVRIFDAAYDEHARRVSRLYAMPTDG
jgi:uncharacterized phosphosugar-binding protein